MLRNPSPRMNPFASRQSKLQGIRPCALTDAITINGVLGRLSTFIQYQPSTPPTARARVNDGTLYIPGTISGVPNKR